VKVWSKDEVLKALNYSCKMKDSNLYEDLHAIHLVYTSIEALKELYHMK
jgi:hypothetical protein